MKKLLLSLVTVATLSASAQVTIGLVAKYSFNSGNANDETGSGHNGTVNGPNLTTDRFGNANHAYDYQGSISESIDCGHFSELDTLSAFTISVWLQKTSATNFTNAIFSYQDRSVNGNPYIKSGNWTSNTMVQITQIY